MGIEHWADAVHVRMALLTPIFLGIGIAIYFSLKNEPPLLSGALGATLGGCGLLLFRKHEGTRIAALAAFLVACGFFNASLSAYMKYAPALDHPRNFALVSGRLIDVSPQSATQARFVIMPFHIEGMKENALPSRIRVSVRGLNDLPKAGSVIRLRASLMPPGGPAVPGGFDFARQAYFTGLGAVGYSFGAPEILQEGEQRTNFYRRAGFALSKLRLHIATRVHAVLPGENGTVAIALITGLRDGIPESIVDDLRDSGLAHLLSISGLHMVLFAGAVFLVSRFLLALIPPLALRWPVKKWAASMALLSAAAYLLISGAEVATQRSFIMIALMFGAMLVDRAALTMRNIALAATIILLIAPESLLNVGFQMSFAAVMALVAGWEWAHRNKTIFTVTGPGLITHIRAYVLGIIATSIWAGLATAPFAAYHFNRITDYTLVADLVVSPAMAFVVMPAAFMTLVAMPAGLEGLPLHIMGWGIDLINATSAKVAAWPGAVHFVPSGPPAALGVTVAGGLFFFLGHGCWRSLGLLGPLIAIALTANASRPDMYVSENGKNIAVRQANGRFVLYSARADSYGAEQWLRRDGDARDVSEAAWKKKEEKKTFTCDKLGCLHRQANGRLIAYVLESAALTDDCARADVIVAPFTVRYCIGPEIVIDGRALRNQGAHALWFDKNKAIKVETAEESRGLRYWNGAVPKFSW